MSRDTLTINLRASEVNHHGAFLCGTCGEEITGGTRGILAHYAEQWYIVIRPYSCDCCGTSTYAPVMCFEHQAVAVIADLSREMAKEFDKFYFEKVALRRI